MSESNLSTITSGITDTMGQIVTAGLAVVGAVALAAIVLFGGIYLWRYGKKVFNVVAK